MSRHYVASDYAGLSGGEMSFYYGYEETIGDEWCFVATEKGKEVLRIPSSKLDIEDKFEVSDCLLAGLSQWLETRK